MENKEELKVAKRENDRRLDKCGRLLFEIDGLLGKNTQAKNIGLFDLLGGGLFVSFYKKSKIQKLKSRLQNIKWLLKEYKEIADVNSLLIVEGKLDIEISNALMNTDIIFDNFLSDMMVNTKLEKFNKELLALQNDVKNEEIRLRTLDLYYKNSLDEIYGDDEN